jgi:hypothetical protein
MAINGMTTQQVNKDKRSLAKYILRAEPKPRWTRMHQVGKEVMLLYDPNHRLANRPEHLQRKGNILVGPMHQQGRLHHLGLTWMLIQGML